MDQLNFKNMLLAYHAVHDEVLCESMDELGFFEGNVDEGYIPLDREKIKRQAGRKMMKFITDPNSGGSEKVSKDVGRMLAVSKAHNPERSQGRSQIRQMIGQLKRITTKNEEYDLFDAVLEHLLDEGYTDSIEGAVAIFENMSDEWLEDIIEARDGYGGDEAFKRGDTDADSFIPGKTVPKPKSYGRLSRFAPSALSGERSRTASNVRRTVGESPNQPRAVQMPGETKARRVIPSRLDKKK